MSVRESATHSREEGIDDDDVERISRRERLDTSRVCHRQVSRRLDDEPELGGELLDDIAAGDVIVDDEAALACKVGVLGDRTGIDFWRFGGGGDELEGEGRACPDRGLDEDVPAEKDGELARDGESQSRPSEQLGRLRSIDLRVNPANLIVSGASRGRREVGTHMNSLEKSFSAIPIPESWTLIRTRTCCSSPSTSGIILDEAVTRISPAPVNLTALREESSERGQISKRRGDVLGQQVDDNLAQTSQISHNLSGATGEYTSLELEEEDVH
jgi:hypothetical protein